MPGRYWVCRTGEWIEALMVVADSPEEAKRIARTIPQSDWDATHLEREERTKKDKPKLHLGGVSLSDTRKAWNE